MVGGRNGGTVTGKSYATLIQEFIVVAPEGAGNFLTWCNIAERAPKVSDFFIEVSSLFIEYFWIDWKHVWNLKLHFSLGHALHILRLTDPDKGFSDSSERKK